MLDSHPDFKEPKDHPAYIPGETVSIHENGPDAEIDFFIHVKKDEYILEIGDETKLVLPIESLCSLGGAMHDAHTEIHAFQIYEANIEAGHPKFIANLMATKVREIMKPEFKKDEERKEEEAGDAVSLQEFLNDLLF